MDVFTQILDNRLPVRASSQVADDTIDNGIQIGSLIPKPVEGLDHSHCRAARPKSRLCRNALEVQDIDNRLCGMRITGISLDLDGSGIGIRIDCGTGRNGRRQTKVVRGRHAVHAHTKLIAARDRIYE